MTKNQYGVWEITVPPTPTGECAIPHDSKIKVEFCMSVASTPLNAIADLHDPHLRNAH